ncbi:type I restriction-modification system subunit M [Pedobacter alluvionis]|nr:class I SAM-dependent DNA methyltransferase [Pedobacter alluvionis]TFB33394.1 SAM-dependent DNA methyltransferase [Pedobacter alluvionis]
MTTTKVHNLSAFAWSIADILRGDFKQSEYGKILLPFVVLRRLDCILENTKNSVLSTFEKMPQGIDEYTIDMMLFNAVGGGLKVYNLSNFTFKKIHQQDPLDVHKNLIDYVTKFNPSVRDIFLDKFLFTDQLKRLKDGGILWQVFEKFCKIDLHPDTVSNIEMGYLFEDLIRKFSEISNETAGEHFTPREVIRLIVDLLLINDAHALAGSGIVRTVYDPACGTGGMLAIAEEQMKNLNPKIRVELYGQELNGESFGICKSDMLVTGHNPEQIAFGNTLTEDAHIEKKFHYMLSNPPYGVDWKKYEDFIKAEAKTLGQKGRFGAGLPRGSDGQLLFLQHMISKLRDDEIGSRIGIVMNGSPLLNGDAGSGESEIRRWIIENDWLEAIIALPIELFYNTDIQTYIWILSSRKLKERKNKIQLIDASSEKFTVFLRKSLGDKRREIPESARHEIVKIYAEMLNGNSEWGEYSKIFDNSDFGYREVRVDRPLRLVFQITSNSIEKMKLDKHFMKMSEQDQAEIIKILEKSSEALFKNKVEFERVALKKILSLPFKISNPLKKLLISVFSQKNAEGDIFLDDSGNKLHDTDLREYENVPLKQDWQDYFKDEIQPFYSDAWIDKTYSDHQDGKIGKVGYEINFNKYFFKYFRPRPLSDINSELQVMEKEIRLLLKELAS